MLSRRIRNGLMVLCLPMWLAACASTCPVQPLPQPVACVKPQVDVTTQGGMAEAIVALAGALDRCNALNGVGGENGT